MEGGRGRRVRILCICAGPCGHDRIMWPCSWRVALGIIPACRDVERSTGRPSDRLARLLASSTPEVRLEGLQLTHRSRLRRWKAATFELDALRTTTSPRQSMCGIHHRMVWLAKALHRLFGRVVLPILPARYLDRQACFVRQCISEHPAHACRRKSRYALKYPVCQPRAPVLCCLSVYGSRLWSLAGTLRTRVDRRLCSPPA